MRAEEGPMLVTVLGTNPKRACYTLGGQSAETDLAPLALVKLLPSERRPARIVALCTPEAAKESWSLLEAGLDGTGIGLTKPPIPSQALTDVAVFLEIVSRSIPVEDPPAALLIDVTHGFRHFAFLTLLAIQYLSALRRVPLRGAYYGLWRPVEKGPSPFLDLRPLLELPDWIHALRAFDESGDASQLAALVEAASNQSARDTASTLRHISEARSAGLPLELGQLSTSFRGNRKKPFREALKVRGALLGDELWRRLDEPLAKFSFSEPVQGQGWKNQVALTTAELSRQAAHVDDLLDRGSIAMALGLMNEWTVSWAALRIDRAGSWLDYHSGRTVAATTLSSLAALACDQALGGGLSDEQRAVGRFWRDLCDLRNGFHHHGMRPQVLVGPGAADVRNKLDAVCAQWQTLKCAPDMPITPPATGRLLVSPIGRRPGVLYSAVEACRLDGEVPEACLVLCSSETSTAIDDALAHAGFRDDVQRLCISDPYGGQSEIECLVRDARKHLVGAQEVLVNITGGTTLMGLAVSAIAVEAQRLARDVRRFGLVDRRPPSEQDADPYRAGEAFWLDRGGSYGD
jgi:CRISPR-associated DxTHG motif protein